MKGVVLAGGLGKRLYPLTRVTNKHLLPVYDRPMICYPIETLTKAGINEALIVTGFPHAKDFIRVLGQGKELGLKRLSFVYQEREGGIADALRLAEGFVKGERFVVILGDNVLDASIKPFLDKFERQDRGGRILIKRVPDPERFGVVEFKGGKVYSIVEKPRNPKSDYIATGVYMYDAQVFDYIRRLKVSGRGELEITDVNNLYLKEGRLTYDILKGNWIDCGTFASLHRASVVMAKKAARQ